MLLRQYKRVRAKQGDDFSYSDIKNVFLIVIYEKSPREFQQFPEVYYHHSRQIFDSGLELDMLQEFIMIPLDIFRKKMHNKTITTAFEAWLTFLSEDDPEKMIQLIEGYPEFKPMYETLYQMCQNMERVMELFSEELRQLDRNTVKYMIEQQQQELDAQAEMIRQQKQELSQKDEELSQKDEQLKKLTEELEAFRRQSVRVNKE